MSELTVVGLGFDEGLEDVPTISCKGSGLVASRIVKLARRYGVPLIERPELVAALLDLEEDQVIPREVYEAVAVIVATLSNSRT